MGVWKAVAEMQGRSALIVKDGRIMIFENGILRVVLWEPQRRKMLREKQIQKFQKLKRRCRNESVHNNRFKRLC